MLAQYIVEHPGRIEDITCNCYDMSQINHMEHLMPTGGSVKEQFYYIQLVNLPVQGIFRHPARIIERLTKVQILIALF